MAIRRREEEVDHGRVELNHAIAPIFRPLPKGSRLPARTRRKSDAEGVDTAQRDAPSQSRLSNFDVRYETGDGTQVRWWGAEPLDPLDLRVLIVVLALAGPARDYDSIGGQDGSIGAVLCSDNALGQAVAQVRATAAQIARILDMDATSGYTRTAITKSIERMSATSITVATRNKKGESERRIYRMIGSYESVGDQRDRFFNLVVSPLLVTALLADRFARIELEELRMVRTSDVATLLLVYLSALVFPGRQRVILLETLVRRVYGDDAIGSTQRMRRKHVRSALSVLAGLHRWRIEAVGDTRYTISRASSHSQAVPVSPQPCRFGNRAGRVAKSARRNDDAA